MRSLGLVVAALMLVALLELEIWGYSGTQNAGNVRGGGLLSQNRHVHPIDLSLHPEQANPVDPIAEEGGTFGQSGRLLAQVSAPPARAVQHASCPEVDPCQLNCMHPPAHLGGGEPLAPFRASRNVIAAGRTSAPAAFRTGASFVSSGR